MGTKKNKTKENNTELLETILNTIPGYVSWVSSDLVYLGVNDSLAQTFGIKKEDLIGKKIGSHQNNHPNDFQTKAQAFFHTNQQKDSFEICIQLQEKEYWHLVEAQKYNGNKNAIFVGIDITAKKIAEWNLQKEQELRMQQEKMASLGELAAGIAHEIKSPLSAIIGNAELIQMNYQDPEKVKKFSEKIQKISDRITKIIKSLQNYSRNGSKDPFELTPLLAIVEDTLELCTEKFRSDKITFQIDTIPQDFFFDCRATEIVQILLNLLKNSADAIEALPVRWIKLGFTDCGDSFQISVTDSGAGIPHEVQKQLMQAFFTTKSIGKGTGIGLNLSRRIALEHGGDLQIDTSCKNTRFVLSLPKSHVAVKKVA